MRFLRRPTNALALVASLLVPLPCFAQGMQALADHIFNFISQDIFTVMGGIVLAFIFYYGVRLIIESQNENALTDAKKSFIYALMGFGALAVTFPIMYSFTTGNENMPINPNPLIPQFYNVIQYITFSARGIFVLLMTFHGLQMLTAQGDEGEMEKARKGIVTNIIGIVLMGIADAIVFSIYSDQPGFIAIQIAGIAAFIVAMVGGISVLALIIAGILLIVSVDESLKEKAKAIVTGTIWSIIICLSSYIIINTFAFS